MKRIAWILLPFFVSACTASADEGEAEAEPAATATVETAVAAVRPVDLTLLAYGSVTPGPQAARSLAAARAGEITGIEVLPGAAVKQGTPLLTLAAAPEAAAAYAQALADAKAARTALAGARSLFEQHLATNAQLADAERTAAGAEAALAAQEKLGGGEAETTVRAPVDGVVSALLVHVGDRVAEDAPLLSFSGTAAPFIQLGIDPEDAARVAPGMGVKVTAVFAPTRSFETRVAQVGARVDEQTGLVEVMAPLPPKAGFMPGSAVSGEIVLQESDTVAVPRSALLRDDEGAYVFTVADGKAHRVDVTPGTDDGAYVAVTRGLKAGERVVTLGNYELEDGMAVREPKT